MRYSPFAALAIRPRVYQPTAPLRNDAALLDDDRILDGSHLVAAICTAPSRSRCFDPSTAHAGTPARGVPLRRPLPASVTPNVARQTTVHRGSWVDGRTTRHVERRPAIPPH